MRDPAERRQLQGGVWLPRIVADWKRDDSDRFANTFTPSPGGRGQPQVFTPGRQRAQFVVPFDGKPLTWTVNGRPATATAMLPQCTAACVQHLIEQASHLDTAVDAGADPLPGRIDRRHGTASAGMTPCPCPRRSRTGQPRLYYGLIYVDTKETLQVLDLFRIHYSVLPVFEQDMSSLEQQGINGKFAYPVDGKGQFVYAMIPGATYNAIRQAALDPTGPIEVVQALPFRPIPATELGFGTQASCGLQPVTQCVAPGGERLAARRLQLHEPSRQPVTVPVGPANTVTGGPAGTLPPEAFAAGTHTAVFAVAIPPVRPCAGL